MKGQQVLFDIFREVEQSKTPRAQRPRNFYLPERNKALAYRYYYHFKMKRKRYEDCLADLEQEFYITEHRLIVVLTENREQLEAILKENPDARKLSGLYPHFNWR